VKIQVTQEHINAGVRGSATSDPIALALKDAGWEKPYVNVFGLQNGQIKRYPLPAGMWEFMYNFDNEKPVKPFEFEVEV
jgi:hypothetical protein